MNNDFNVRFEGSVSILTPVSSMAKDWCFEYLTDDCLRWGVDGFVIETNFLGDILEGIASEDLSVSRDV